MAIWTNVKSNIRPAIAGLVACILLLAMVNHANADANEDRDRRLAEKFAPILVLTENPTPVGRDYAVINPEPVEIVGANHISNVWLTAYDLKSDSQIDSSTVEVGAVVAVIYGHGQRHPVSGSWAKLDTMRGYIKAVDQRRLILGLAPDGWSRWIALERIQTLVLVGAPLPGAAKGPRAELPYIPSVESEPPPEALARKLVQSDQAEPGDSLAVKAEPMDSLHTRVDSLAESRGSMSTGKRVGLKIAAGTVVGLLGVLIGSPYAEVDNDVPFYGLEAVVFGYGVGTAIGVSWVDPRDHFIRTLGGSAVGVIGGDWLLQVNDDVFWPYVLAGPAIGATLSSELWRKPPVFRRVLVGLVLNSEGGLSAVAMLRF
ncbi:MAG: hypothetical protein J4F35_08215 [Candidatus Latescibacteria bacterium]|nr:hypothetical protein [Candidatus Latescibacterota bacterium]